MQRLSLAILLALAACASDGLLDPSEDTADIDSPPAVEFLSNEDKGLVWDAFNFDCVFGACDGDFGWLMTSIDCDSVSATCVVYLGAQAHESVGTLDETAAAAMVGTFVEADEGQGTYRAAVNDIYDDEDGPILEMSCTLYGYMEAAQILSDDSLDDDFENHFLDCSLALQSRIAPLILP